MSENNVVEKIKRNLPNIDQMVNITDGKKRGSEIQGSHPIHGSDTGNNLILHTDTNTWHCFRHDVHSDRLGWIAVQEGLVSCKNVEDISDVFPQVLEIASKRAGIDLKNKAYDKVEMKKKRKEREILKKGFKAALEYFKNNLNKKVVDWVKKKYGFSEEHIERFDIGYSPPDERGLLKVLEREISESAYKTGLIHLNNGKFKDFFRGRVIFPYKIQKEPVYFIARETPWTPENNFKGNKYLKQLVGKNKNYVSEQVTNRIFGADSVLGKEKLIITEGITDAISAQIWGNPVISPVSKEFKKDHIKKVKNWVKNRDVYIANDADKGGKEGALSMIEEFDKSYMIELPEDYDLNEFYQEYSKEDFEELVDSALLREEALSKYKEDVPYIFLSALKEESIPANKVRKVWNNENQCYDFYSIYDILEGIDDIKKALAIFRRSEKSYKRTPTAVENSQKKRIISGVVKRHMEKNGKFLFDKKTDGCFYYSENRHDVFDIESQYGKAYLDENYGVKSSTKEGEMILGDLNNYTNKNGEEIEVRKYFFYDKEENVLYIHDRNQRYYKLDGEKIERKYNGEDVFFKKLKDGKVEYIEEGKRKNQQEIKGQISKWEGEGNFLHKVLVNRVNFKQKTALSPRQQRCQFLISLYMYPFGSMFQTKPIQAFIGEKGSGKSMVMKMLGLFLKSEDYDVSPLPERDDFFVSAHNNSFYFLDNVDRSKKWLNDALATVSTGGKMKQRKLYTNFEEIDADIGTFLAVTSRDPYFRRDDVVDRLLIYNLKRKHSKCIFNVFTRFS